MDKDAEQALATAVGRTIAGKPVEAGLTQEQVAEKPGLQREAVARVERGTAIPTVVRLAGLADLFGCRTDELLIEASTLPADQATTILRLLERVSLADRQMLPEWLDAFKNRLQSRPR